MNYLLDTDIVVSFLRGKRKAGEMLDKLGDESEISISIITYGELVYGANKAEDYETEMDKLEGLLQGARIGITKMTEATMLIYGRVRKQLERKGQRVDDFDLLIGANAIENELFLVTDNEKHFARFPGLKVYGGDKVSA